MVLTRIFDSRKLGPMKVAGFMSGKGTNLIKIIEHERALVKSTGLSPYQVAVIFSDNSESNAVKIGKEFAIPTFVYDLEAFCAKKKVSVKDMTVRAKYEQQCLEVLKTFECPVAAYAGYMRKATPVFVDAFLGVNVHPADLTIKGENGKPKYRGDHTVLDAILAGEKEVRSTTHLVENKVDCGPILMVSAPVKIAYHPVRSEIEGNLADKYQDKLKEAGDWVIFPKTLEYMASGRFALDDKGDLYFDEKPIPNGVRLTV